jgi:hypothetical protein
MGVSKFFVRAPGQGSHCGARCAPSLVSISQVFFFFECCTSTPLLNRCYYYAHVQGSGDMSRCGSSAGTLYVRVVGEVFVFFGYSYTISLWNFFSEMTFFRHVTPKRGGARVAYESYAQGVRKKKKWA